jgi:hypothetical protein
MVAKRTILDLSETLPVESEQGRQTLGALKCVYFDRKAERYGHKKVVGMHVEG